MSVQSSVTVSKPERSSLIERRAPRVHEPLGMFLETSANYSVKKRKYRTKRGTIYAYWYCGAHTILHLVPVFSCIGTLAILLCDHRLDIRDKRHCCENIVILTLPHSHKASAHQGSSFDSCPFCFSRNSRSASRTCLQPATPGDESLGL